MICAGWVAMSAGCRTVPVGGAKSQPGKESRMYASTKEVRVGKVTLVKPKDRFLLIRSERGVSLPDDAPLEVRDASGEITAELELSPEQSGLDLVADIESGNPGRGETVYYVFGSHRSGSAEVDERFKKGPAIPQEEPVLTPVSLSEPDIGEVNDEGWVDDTNAEEDLPAWVTPEG